MGKAIKFDVELLFNKSNNNLKNFLNSGGSGGESSTARGNTETKKQTGLLGGILRGLLPLGILTSLKPVADGIQILVGLMGLGVMKLVDLVKWLGSFYGDIGSNIGSWFMSFAESVWDWTLNVGSWFTEKASNFWDWTLNVGDFIKSKIVGGTFNIIKYIKKLLGIDDDNNNGSDNKDGGEQAMKDYMTPKIADQTFVPDLAKNTIDLDNQMKNAVFANDIYKQIDKQSFVGNPIGGAISTAKKIFNFYGVTTDEIVNTINQQSANDAEINGLGG